MRRMIIAAIAAMTAGVMPAQATPIVLIDFRESRLGDVYIENDIPGSIINIKSSAGRLVAPTFPNGPIPAPVFVDEGDLPFYLAFLNTPVGRFKLGNGMLTHPDTLQDITMEWYPAFGLPAVKGSVLPIFPEPSGALMASLATIGLVSARRSRRPRRGAG